MRESTRARVSEDESIEDEATTCRQLSMYDSELFKTAWTKIGQMCSYIICAKSYLSGQFDERVINA